MPASNFEFLNKKLPDLAALGEFSEQYTYADPSSSVVKLRLFSEKCVEVVYTILNLPKDSNETLNDLIEKQEFQNSVPQTVIQILHFIRKIGNKGAHGGIITSELALDLIKKSYELGKWLFATFLSGKLEELPNFTPPENKTQLPSWKQEKEELLEELYSKEENVDSLLKELTAEREKLEKVKKSKEEIEKVLKRGSKVAGDLKFSEANTRKLLIDTMIADAGWEIGPNGVDTDEVTKEEEVENQPTPTGIGYADYVLWYDNGTPLAVIEAKKTSVDPRLGKKQAELYADSLEKKYNQRPIIFYTNGYQTWIWNDKAKEVPRKVFGIYSKDSLWYLISQRKEEKPVEEIKVNTKIVNRRYQIESVKRIYEKFDTKRRKALIVQATGTGKTRVAIALAEALINAGWVKRVLFLCDRNELRKQAYNAFKDFIPSEPAVIVSYATSKIRDKRLYFATYPAMIKYYETFDVGFFDLIIADESHRSIYKIYRDLFEYFDCYQVGLTATPISFINKSTFEFFDCEDLDPDSNFGYEEAINHQPPYLVPYEVFNVTTDFLRKGIKYSQMDREQKIQTEEQLQDPNSIEYEASEVDKYVFNKDTNKIILQNLMDNGIKDDAGNLGKTIIFARNHVHALLLSDIFDELYPEYGSKFCQVIDNYDPRAEQLIDDFKGFGTNDKLTIAISVDMLDTGIDVPEIVNLVFAKPVKSYVKFWQMIGRGTRLCENLFGPGKNKTVFRIFDHWGNFEWFDEHYKQVEPAGSKPMMQRLFEERILLAEATLQKFDRDSFNLVTDLILADISTLANTKVIRVKDNMQQIKQLEDISLIKSFDAHTVNQLKNTIAPLMQWINIKSEYDSYAFDLLITKAQSNLIAGTGKFEDLQGDIINTINNLNRNLNQVREKFDYIARVSVNEWWQGVNTSSLEEMRLELRSIMKYHYKTIPLTQTAQVIDVEDKDIINEKYNVRSSDVTMATYKQRVDEVLKALLDKSLTLRKIRNGQKVTDKDLTELVSLVLTQHPDIDIKVLEEFYPETSGKLDLAIRRVIGLDPLYIDKFFTRFVHGNPKLTATQIKFIDLLKMQIEKFGAFNVEQFYEAPFINIHSDSIYGVFPEGKDAEKIINIVREVSSSYSGEKTSPKSSP